MSEKATLNNPYPNIIYSSSIAMIGRVAGRGIGYLTQIILARILAPEGYGLFAIGWTFLRLFSIAGHLGLDHGITKFGTRYFGKNYAKFNSLVIFSISGAFISGIFFGVILSASSSWLSEIIFKKPELDSILKGIALVFPFATTLRVLAATSSLQGKTLYGAIFEDVIQPLAQITFFALLLLRDPNDGINAAITSTIISYVLSTIIGGIFVRRLIPNTFLFKNIITEDLIPLLKFSLPAIAGATLGAFNLWGDRLLVGYFGTKSDTGIYQSISIITMLTTIVLSGMKISAAPAISQMNNNNRRSEIESLSKSISRWSLYITLPILLSVLINTNGVITILFGEQYQAGAAPLLILTIGQSFYVMYGIIDQILLMTGKQKEWLAISAIVFYLTILFDALLIPKFHLMGASVVSTAMIFLLGILSIFYLKHHLRFWLLDISHIRIIATAIFTGLIAYPLTVQLPFGIVANTFLSFVITSILFAIFLFLYGMDTREKIQLQNIIISAKIKSPSP